jgi:hypothetical protein
MLLSDTLASGNLTTLEAIAEQCPLEGGDAVYEARAIVSYFTGQDYDDGLLCASGERDQRRTGGDTQLKTEERIYPNPTTGEVFFSVAGEARVQIFNNIGQLQREQLISDNRLTLSNLHPGLYRLRIFRDGQAPVTRNIVVINR